MEWVQDMDQGDCFIGLGDMQKADMYKSAMTGYAVRRESSTRNL